MLTTRQRSGNDPKKAIVHHRIFTKYAGSSFDEQGLDYEGPDDEGSEDELLDDEASSEPEYGDDDDYLSSTDEDHEVSGNRSPEK